MTDDAAPPASYDAASRTLRFERLLDAPIAVVWTWLTDPEKRKLWFMGGAVDLREGGVLTLIADHDNLSDRQVAAPASYAQWKGRVMRETILEIDPPHLIGFSWSEGKQGRVRITLAAEGDRTRLVLVHSGIADADGARSFAGGWTSHLGVLARRIAGKSVDDFWVLHRQSEAQAAILVG